MQDFYEAVDVVVLPSHSEGLPNVALEGMAAKRAVVTTDVGGVREIIDSGSNGWIVPPGDRLAMAEVIKKVVVNEKLRTEIAEKGYRSLYPKFSPQKRAQSILAVYDELINKSR
jgi:glycosyltransferase involved in cell wall biosynthesis